MLDDAASTAAAARGQKRDPNPLWPYVIALF